MYKLPHVPQSLFANGISSPLMRIFLIYAYVLTHVSTVFAEGSSGVEPGSLEFWLKLLAVVGLVAFGGLMAGIPALN